MASTSKENRYEMSGSGSANRPVSSGYKAEEGKILSLLLDLLTNHGVPSN